MSEHFWYTTYKKDQYSQVMVSIPKSRPLIPQMVKPICSSYLLSKVDISEMAASEETGIQAVADSPIEPSHICISPHIYYNMFGDDYELPCFRLVPSSPNRREDSDINGRVTRFSTESQLVTTSPLFIKSTYHLTYLDSTRARHLSDSSGTLRIETHNCITQGITRTT